MHRMILQHEMMQYQIVEHDDPRGALRRVVDLEVCRTVAHVVQDGVIGALPMVVRQ